MKVERFLQEYANHKKKSILECELMKEEIKTKAIKSINNTLKAKERGLITVDEAIKNILECCQ